MASISQISAGPGEGDAACRFERVGPRDRRLALSVLLSGEPSGDEGVVDQFLRYSREEALSLDELWLAWEADRPAAATLIVPCPGRTAMQFVSPASAWSSSDTAAALFRHAAEAQDTQRCHLIQALLEPDQPRTQSALVTAGFEELAVLAYMRVRSTVRPHELSLADLTPADPLYGRAPEPIRVLHWSEANQPAFERAILASYEQTRDCPGLLGKRRIEDILAGHMAAGLFRPNLWHALYVGDQPVGVMLLNDVPATEALELVYLGLAVPWRGRGLARRLVYYGLGLVAQCGRDRMILAVDESNEPAVQLYRDLGFRSTGRKRAMIYTPQHA